MDPLFIAVIIVAMDYIYFRYKYAKPDGPPVWYGFPFLGLLPFYGLPNPLFNWLYRWYLRKFPDVIITRFVYPCVIVKNAAVQDVQNSDHCLSRASNGFEKALGYFTVGKPYWFAFDHNQEECDWRSVRKTNVAALNVLPKHQKFERITEVVENFLKTIEDQKGRLFDYENDIFFAKIQETSNVNLSQCFQANEVPKFIANIRKIMSYLSYIILITTVVPFKFIVMFENFLPELVRPTLPRRIYINFTRRILEGKTRITEKPRDFIEAVLRLKEPRAALDFMRETSLLNMVATTHTTQHTTMATLSFVSLNEPIKKRIQEELMAVVGCGTLRVEHLSDLHYLKAVIHEVYRMSPPIPLTLRWTTASTRIGGYQVEPNMRVGVLLVSENRDLKNFPDPDEFVPERYLNECGQFEASKHFNIFSRGKRMCSGQEIANMSALVYCAKILQGFDVIPESENMTVPNCDGSFFPKTPLIPLRFVRREGAPAIKPVVLNSGLTAILSKVLREETAMP